IHEAQKMVGKAERSLLQEDVDAAWPVVNALPDGEEKDKLIERLNFVQSAIDVVNQINELPEVEDLTLRDREAVEEARRAYEALHENPKQRIPRDILAKLEALEARLEELETEEPYIEKIINSISWNGFIQYNFYNYKNLPGDHYSVDIYFKDDTVDRSTVKYETGKPFGYALRSPEEIQHFEITFYEKKGQFGPYEELMTIDNIPFEPSEIAIRLYKTREA